MNQILFKNAFGLDTASQQQNLQTECIIIVCHDMIETVTGVSS